MVIARLHGRAGDRQRAEAQLEAVNAHPSFAALEEPWCLATLTDACHLTCDTRLADRLYHALLPRVQQISWLGPLGASIDLPFARHLGLLAETLGRYDDAVAHLEDAEARASGAGMRAHLARVWYELARALLARRGAGDLQRAARLVADARALASELGQTGLLDRLAELAVVDSDAPPAPVAAAGPPRLSLHREGEYWSVEWAGRAVRLRNSRGVSLLAQLVASPGQELHVLQLASPGAERSDAGDAGPVLDPRAVHDYRHRLLDLREELEEAERLSDTARAEKARAEMEFLTHELASAVGLGGRERRTGHAAERARTAVQKRLRETLRRIEHELPELGRHLDQTIHTGVFCAYLPDGRRR
jgi:hypothetical protein